MRRASLFLKYAILFVGLVAAVLVINAALDLYFVYQDNRRASIEVQQEKAEAAAQRIESFVREIERQIGWVAQVQWSALPVEQRRFDYVRLLRQVPAITELVQLDRQGREQLKVSRLSMDVVGSGADRSKDPAFIEALAHRVWFGPVYFRKGSEPYMTMAVAHGRRGGVTVAEVNLKLIWDVVSQIKVGKDGYAYVVGPQGRLVAHPDISLVLRGTDMKRLAQVAQALDSPADGTAVDAKNLGGVSVLSAHARIPALNWLVFVEVPTAEAQRPVLHAGLRALALLVLGLLIAGLVGALLARRMVVPIRAMQAGAERIGSGELGHRLAITTGDELESLANQFNRTAAALQDSYEDLEKKVEARSSELREALEYQTAISDVLRVMSRSTFDLEPVLLTVIETAANLCRAQMGGVFQLEPDGAFRWKAGYALDPQYQEHERMTALYPGEDTLVGRVALRGVPVSELDALADPTYGPKDIADVGQVRSMLGVPMMRDGKLFGVMCLARTRVEAFTERQVELVTVFADQAVIAIENVRLINEIRDKSRQLEIASQHKSQFLANMSHELRTPLNAIIGYTEMMADGLYGDLSEKAQGVLERVQANGRHLLGLINDVLDLSKIEAGQLVLATEEYSVVDIVATVLSATESLARAKGLKLGSEVAPGLPTGTGDARRLTQVLLNLVGNAIKFTDQGSVTVHARRTGEHFELSVIDTGFGIAPADQARIFDEFQQVDDTSTRKKGGTGLGLSISRKIVELHGGRITVESEVGKGSTFTVVVPINAASIKEAAQ